MTTTTKNIYCSAYLSEFPVLASREHVGVSIVSHEDGIHPEVTVTDVILVEVVIVIVIVVGGGGLPFSTLSPYKVWIPWMSSGFSVRLGS